jgi:DNA-binding CsgD family transcriptional regulator
MAADAVVGRDQELAMVAGALERARSGAVALRVEGEAGVGKTTILNALLDRAREAGMRVLRAVAGELERDLPHVVLGDLLEPVADELAELAPPQRRALEAILLRESPSETVDARTVGVMLLSSLRLLTRRGPLVVVVDDAQWADASSRTALHYAARRLDPEPVLMAVARRTPNALSEGGVGQEDRLLPLEITGRTEVITLAGLGVTDLEEALRRRGVRRLVPSQLAEVHRLSAGNPLLAFELAGTGEWRGVAGAAVSPPERMQRAITARLQATSPRTRELLAAVAALRRPTRSALEALAGPGDAAYVIDEASAANILVPRADRLEFSHPLVRSAVLAELGPEEVAALHRRVTPLSIDPDERAYHLALGTELPDGQISREVAEASATAARRGAPAEASILAEHAARLTPADDEEMRTERLRLAGEYAFMAGDSRRATDLLQRAAAMAGPGDGAALVRLVQAQVEADTVSVPAALSRMRDALALARSDAASARILTNLADIGRAVSLDDARRWARRAVDHANRAADPTIEARALAIDALLEFNATGEVQASRIARAVQLEESGLELDGSPSIVLAHQLVWSGQIEEGRRLLERLLEAREGRGNRSSVEPLWYLAVLEWLAGNWDRAEDLVVRCIRLDEQAGRDASLVLGYWVLGLIQVCRGDLTNGRELVARLMELAKATGQERATGSALWLLALADHFEARASDHAVHALEMIESVGHPLISGALSVPDLSDILVSRGQVEAADRYLRPAEERATRLNHPFGLPHAKRARAAILAAEGEVDRALEVLEPWADPGAAPQFPLYAARIGLLRGQLLRRRRERAAAREALESAAALFTRLGALPWLRATEAELRLLGRAPRRPTELTPAEARVAELAAKGKSNGEIASALYLSPKTVEWTLTRVYGKLGLRSRTELASTFAAWKGHTTPPMDGSGPSAPDGFGTKGRRDVESRP